MPNTIKNHLELISNIESKEVLNEAGAAGLGSKAMGAAGKLVPGLAVGLAAKDAYSRTKAGDYTGAALGAAQGVPILGWGAMGAQAVRDKMRTGSFFPSDEEITAAVGKDNEEQEDLEAQRRQQEIDTLLRKKAQMPESVSESEKISALRDRLNQIESSNLQEAGLGDIAKAIGKGAAEYGGKALDIGGKAAKDIAGRLGAAGKAFVNPAAASAEKTAVPGVAKQELSLVPKETPGYDAALEKAAAEFKKAQELKKAAPEITKAAPEITKTMPDWKKKVLGVAGIAGAGAAGSALLTAKPPASNQPTPSGLSADDQEELAALRRKQEIDALLRKKSQS